VTGREQLARGLELDAILRWLPAGDSLHVLEIGCGVPEGLGQLLESGGVREFVGVDLDEAAVRRARARWPQATFLCADAARLPPSLAGRFHVVLVRRPDLLAQPGRWREVLHRVPVWLHPGGRAVLSVTGQAEALVASRWLEEAGLRVTHREERADLGLRLCVAEAPPVVVWDGSGEVCDTRTGRCSPGARGDGTEG
jgi:SAM-dependent methyltransferase